MVSKRRYDDPCGLARALDLVGERWALLVVRELLHGPKRFTDLRQGLPTASQNVLAQRLRELVDAGIARRRKLAAPAASWVYELTEHGAQLEQPILALARWGSRTPLSSTAELSVDALVLALKTTFDAKAACGLRARFELRLGTEVFHAEVGEGGFRIARGAATAPDAVLETTVTTLRSLVFGGAELTGAIADRTARVSGDEAALGRLLMLFPRPADTLSTSD